MFAMNTATEAAWLGRTNATYTNRYGQAIFVVLERYRTQTAATTLFGDVADAFVDKGSDVPPPSRGRFDEVAAMQVPRLSSEYPYAICEIMARDGSNIVLVIAVDDPYGDTDIAFDIFDAIATTSGGSSGDANAGFVPSAAEISQAGFTLGETTTSRDVTDSTFTMNASTEAGWLSTTLTVITGYAPDGEWINANIRIEEFTSASSANGLFLDIDEGFRADGAWQRPPGAGRFDQITMMYDYRTEYDYTNTVIIARYDATVVVVSVWGDVGADTTPVAVDLFALIS